MKRELVAKIDSVGQTLASLFLAGAISGGIWWGLMSLTLKLDPRNSSVTDVLSYLTVGSLIGFAVLCLGTVVTTYLLNRELNGD